MQAQSATIDSSPAQVVWVVGQIDGTGDEYTRAWTLQGVFSDRERAIAACLNYRYFIGPVTVDVELPEHDVEWAGAFYPILKQILD